MCSTTTTSSRTPDATSAIGAVYDRAVRPNTRPNTMQAIWLACSALGGAGALGVALAVPIDRHADPMLWASLAGAGLLGAGGAYLSGVFAPVREGVGVVTAPLVFCAPALAGVALGAARASTPLFSLCLGLAMLWWLAGSAGALRSLLRRHRADTPHVPDLDHTPAHLCRACGYDLRGLPERNPCPECGGAIRADTA